MSTVHWIQSTLALWIIIVFYSFLTHYITKVLYEYELYIYIYIYMLSTAIHINCIWLFFWIYACLQTLLHVAPVLPRTTMSIYRRTQLMTLCILWGQRWTCIPTVSRQEYVPKALISLLCRVIIHIIMLTGRIADY